MLRVLWRLASLLTWVLWGMLWMCYHTLVAELFQQKYASYGQKLKVSELLINQRNNSSSINPERYQKTYQKEMTQTSWVGA